MKRAVVVGGGQAGAHVAIGLRELGFSGTVALVGAEPHQPYQRPPLSKAYLSGEGDETSLELRSADFYRDHGIDVITGERAVSITAADGRGRVRTDSGRELPHDGLALATGVRARRLNVPGVDATGVHYLRNFEDAAGLRRALERAEQMRHRVVIVGAGFIGLEIAAACTKRGIDVMVVEAADRVLARAVGPDMSSVVADAHRHRGVRLLLECSVIEVLVDDDRRASGIRTSDGGTIECGVVVVGIGSSPRVELAEQLGLECQGGIIVDEFCQTSQPGIVAAGDCAVFQPSWSNVAVRLESVPNAIEQGRIAASTLLGIEGAEQSAPWFWSDQGDLKLQIAGWTHDFDECVLRQGSEPDRVSAVYFRRGRLIGIEALNSPHDFNAVKRALASARSMPVDQVADSAVPLKELLASASNSSRKFGA